MAKNMKAAFALLILVVCGCSTPRSTNHFPPGKGTLLASIRVTDNAFAGSSRRVTGTFFYLKQSPPTSTPSVYIYDLSNGRVVDFLGGGLDDSAETTRLIAPDLEPFDFATEVARTKKKLEHKARLHADSFYEPVVLDGAEYELIINTNKGRFMLRDWNPATTIDFYAPHSAKIAKLKAYIDTLSLHYGRLSLGL